MDNPEYTFQILEVFSKIRTREIPRELEEYISYVARTGDPVFQWSLVKVLIKEKLLVVLDDFMEGNPNIEIPPCPNVDSFNYEIMKNNLLNRLDAFVLPPFTIQRLCELLSVPRKEYNRIDKYMRAVEKNVMVVSANDLTVKRGLDGDSSDAVINGILYDKVNDSLNNVSNHVFSGEEADTELSVSSKLDETDAVQQMIEESWNEDNDTDFKLNGGSDSSSLGVNFENELQFVTEKTSEEKDLSCESKESSDSSFSSNSMLLDSSLQNIIGENSNMEFDNISKSEESFESKNNDTYEFKNDSQSENELSVTSETTEAFDDKSENISDIDKNVSNTIEAAPLNSVPEDDEEKSKHSEYVLMDSKTDTADECQLNTEKETSFEYVSEIDAHASCESEKETAIKECKSTNELDDVQNNDDNIEAGESCDSFPTSNENNVTLESESGIEMETKLSCGDNEQIRNVEEIVSQESIAEAQCEESEPSE